METEGQGEAVVRRTAAGLIDGAVLRFERTMGETPKAVMMSYETADAFFPGPGPFVAHTISTRSGTFRMIYSDLIPEGAIWLAYDAEED